MTAHKNAAYEIISIIQKGKDKLSALLLFLCAIKQKDKIDKLKFWKMHLIWLYFENTLTQADTV